MTVVTEQETAAWGYRWRSSSRFVITSMALAIFTDELLIAFMVPLLPYVIEQRLQMDPELTQRYTSIILGEGAFVSLVTSPFVGTVADAVASKKLLLLVLLGMALVTVLCLSATTSLTGILIGRGFQGLTTNAIWVVSMATMAETVGTQHMGKIAALGSIVSAAGTSAGPAVSGFLFGLGGYWTAWAGAIGFLVANITMRLLMIEKPREPRESREARGRNPTTEDETAPLLGGDTTPTMNGWALYTYLLRQPRFAAAVFCYFTWSVLVMGFAATIAPHARETFGWGVFPVGVLYAGIQMPGVILGPLVGWLKDRVGSRTPTAAGLLAMVPCLFLSGVAGDTRFEWAAHGTGARALYATCMVLSGCFMCFLTGVGTMEATATVDKLEECHPGITGPNGGYSRAVSVTLTGWMLGALAAPVVAGFVVERYGYFEFQCVLAILTLVTGVTAVTFLTPESDRVCEDSKIDDVQ